MGTEVHKYTWRGSKLISEQYGDTELEFFYNESGAPYALLVRDTASATTTEAWYYYVTNLQGDVMQILDASGNTVASYTYNAWGKVLNATNSTTASIGDLNPIRYRGYYYDAETGLYYLKSRYYDPEICRWINADDASLIGANDDFTSVNLFVYCGNNPVCRADFDGEDWETVLRIGTALVVIGVLAAITIGSGGTAALALAGVGVTATAANATVVAGLTLVGGSIIATFSKESKKSGKERASDRPSWTNRDSVDPNLSAQQNATEILNEKYGVGNWNKGPKTEFNQIVKWITRSLKMLIF